MNMLIAVFLLIALVTVIGLTALAGGVLFLVGLLRKKRTLCRVGAIVLVLSLVGLAGCFTYVSVRVFNKLRSASPGQYWHALVDMAFNDTGIRPFDPAKAKQVLSGKVGNTTFLNGVDVQGVWAEGAVLSYGYFLYTADEKELLSAVACAPVDPSYRLTSDPACKQVTWAECKDDLLYKNGPQRNLPGWVPEGVAEKRCYQCTRCPWLHTILIDARTGKVYHSISEIRE
jgi:hypothetical protein